MTLRLNGSTSGYTEIDSPAVGANNLLTLPSTPNGTLTATDSSGRLLVGTSSSRSQIGVIPSLQVEATGNLGSIGSINNSANNVGAYIMLGKTRGASVGSATSVISGDTLGGVYFQGADGTNLVCGASIEALVDGTPGANDMPGRLVFSTTADGASSPTERMRITQEGYARFNTTGDPNTAGNIGAQIGFSGQNFWRSRSSGTASYGHMLFHNDNGAVGGIATSGSSTSFTTSSDYRLKENVVPLTGAIDRVSQLQVHRFNFIADPDRTVDGFIAHEAQAVVPECVTGTKDEVDADGSPVYQGIDQSKLVPLLTAALQEAIAKIETLESRIAALEVTP